MRILSNKFYSEKKGEGNEEHNGPAFKRRGFSVFMKVTELISYLKVKNSGATSLVRLKTPCYTHGFRFEIPSTSVYALNS
jgi:hypothetical protein